MGQFTPHAPWDQASWFFQFHFIGFSFPLACALILSLIFPSFPPYSPFGFHGPLTLYFTDLSSDSPCISSNAIYPSILPCWTLHPAFDISFLFFFFCSERPLPLDALHYNSSRLFLVSPIHYFPLIFLPISSPVCSPYMSIS